MNIHLLKNYDEISKEAAQFVHDEISRGLKQKGKFVLGLATGSTPQGMYKHLIAMLSASKMDLSQLYTFNLDEYYPIQQDDENSYTYEMLHTFWEPLHKVNPTFDPGHGHVPNGEALDHEEECIRYENHLEELGGLDLQILGIGKNGHIGFNEPGSAGDSRARKVAIAAQTRIVNAKKFFNGDLDLVPHYALTMGIQSILDAHKIVLLASGEEKKEIMAKFLSIMAPNPEIPASFLITHKDVTVFTDIS